MTQQQYVEGSLELHLFFGRIMKEHALFLEAGFTPAAAAFIRGAEQYKDEFEKLLHNAIRLSNGVVSADVLSSGELVTEYTISAEQQTQNLTGIMINQNLTVMESTLTSLPDFVVTPELVNAVSSLNAGAIQLLDSFIAFKTQILNSVLSCTMFTVNYPLLIEHILREAKLYLTHLTALEGGYFVDTNAREVELFWDRIMMEHTLFIRGLLDPTEGDLIRSANDFAITYSQLIQESQAATDAMLASVTNQALEDTLKLRDFKAAGAKGLTECQIRSIILPLLADHVLREANHYIRLLETLSSPAN